MEPSAWCFAVPEKLLGYEQFIDITGDDTGVPHKAARALPSIYVNEVGHNRKLVQNVRTSDKDDRAVECYIHIHQPLKKDASVELLTDYSTVYETTRERKGYGLANLLGQTKDDNHEPSRLQRNFGERTGIVDRIMSQSLVDLFHSVEFLCTRILPPIKEVTNVLEEPSSSQTQQQQQPSRLQLVGRRRLHWLADVMRRRLCQLKDYCLDESKLGVTAAASLREQLRIWIEEMEWNVVTESRALSFAGNKELEDAFDEESVEEVLFELRHRLAKPLDEMLWCPVARDLTRELCKVTFSTLRCRHLSQSTLTFLLERAKKAANDVKSACAHPEKARALVGFDPEIVKSRRASYFDAQAYNDAMELAMETRIVDDSAFRVDRCRDAIVMCRDSRGLETSPRVASLVERGFVYIDETWYLANQVLYIVNAFAVCVCEIGAESMGQLSPEDLPEDVARMDAASFLSDLCKVLDIDKGVADESIVRGMRLAESHISSRRSRRAASTRQSTGRKTEREIKPKKPEREIKAKKPKQVSATPQMSTVFDAVIWKTLTSLGWKLKVGNRPNDFYYMPTGTQRGRGYRCRKDYFDSKKQVLECLRTQEKWRNREEIKECLQLYDRCQLILARQKPPRGVSKLEWVLAEAEKLGK